MRQIQIQIQMGTHHVQWVKHKAGGFPGWVIQIEIQTQIQMSKLHDQWVKQGGRVPRVGDPRAVPHFSTVAPILSYQMVGH